MTNQMNIVLQGDAEPEPASPPGGIVSANSRVYNALKERILSNQFSAGYKLTLQELAELFGVSRTPAREALERLYQEGFVTHTPNRGFFVAQIDEEEARQLFELREALELHALRVSVERGTTFDLSEAEAINKEYQLAVQGNHSKHRISLDRDFHVAIASHCRNDCLLRSLEGIFERIMFKLRMESYPPLPSAAYQEHVELLQTLAAQDFAKASGLLSRHVRAGFDRLLGGIR